MQILQVIAALCALNVQVIDTNPDKTQALLIQVESQQRECQAKVIRCVDDLYVKYLTGQLTNVSGIAGVTRETFLSACVR